MGLENVTFNKYGQNELASSDKGNKWCLSSIVRKPEILLSSIFIPCAGCSERGSLEVKPWFVICGSRLPEMTRQHFRQTYAFPMIATEFHLP